HVGEHEIVPNVHAVDIRCMADHIGTLVKAGSTAFVPFSIRFAHGDHLRLQAYRFAVHGASVLQTRQLPTLIIPQIDPPDNPGLSNHPYAIPIGETTEHSRSGPSRRAPSAHSKGFSLSLGRRLAIKGVLR